MKIFHTNESIEYPINEEVIIHTYVSLLPKEILKLCLRQKRECGKEREKGRENKIIKREKKEEVMEFFFLIHPQNCLFPHIHHSLVYCFSFSPTENDINLDFRYSSLRTQIDRQ